jgi:hypothetical protein
MQLRCGPESIRNIQDLATGRTLIKLQIQTHHYFLFKYSDLALTGGQVHLAAIVSYTSNETGICKNTRRASHTSQTKEIQAT